MTQYVPWLSVLLLGPLPYVHGSEPSQSARFTQESRTFHTTADGLSHNTVTDIKVDQDGNIYAKSVDNWTVLKPGSRRWALSNAPLTGISLDQDRLSRSHGAQTGNNHPATPALPWTDRIQGPVSQRVVSDGNRRWLPQNALVVRDGQYRFWFADRQGVGCLDNAKWTLFTGAEGVPFTDFTCAAADAEGTIWFGTTKGVVRFDGQHWAYRQGKRWLPDDSVRSIALAQDGSAWIATDAGISHIHFVESTLAEKARFFEAEIDKHNRRTEFGYVIEAHALSPGNKSSLTHQDNDNDGLWTSMYGAGQCFAWAATKSPKARQRARQAFEALRFLSIAPRGGPNPAPYGFIARTVVPTSRPDPNEREGYTLAGQQRRQNQDSMWRVYSPRWPITEDGRYYWKSDTSSDELDGHYFFYGLYYDLVADTEEEKERVREIVRDNIDHLILHDFQLYDHAGATRWADYSPASLNHDIRWSAERGLNSLSILSYLATAAHMTGNTLYSDVAQELCEQHGYHQNVLVPKIQAGIGSGNQSDDEMAFMCFYNLLKYEPDQKLRMRYLSSFWQYWLLERPEMNPFFNFCYAAAGLGKTFTNQWGTIPVSPPADWLDDSVDTLRRFPLDRFDWAHTNSHRSDLLKLPGPGIDTSGRLYRRNGKVIPVDECHFNHWNRNPWQPDTGGSGQTLACGSVFLLPYYMGLYHSFIAD